MPPNGLHALPLYLHASQTVLGASSLDVFNFWIQLGVGIGLLIGIIWGFIKAARGILGWFRRRRTQEVAAEVKGELDPIIGALVKAAVNEFLPNGGKSIKDSVTRIDKDVAELKVGFAGLDAKVDVVLDLVTQPLVRQEKPQDPS